MKKFLEQIFLILAVIATLIGVLSASIYGLYWVAQFIWFLQDNNFFGFPIWTFLGISFVIAAFINNVYSELKFNKKEPTRKNLIAQTKLSIIIFTLFSLVVALAIYLINLWKGFIFIFLILGFLSTFRKNFRTK